MSPPIPISTIGPEDEAQSGSLDGFMPSIPNPNVNYATDEGVVQYIRDHVLPTIMQARHDRQGLEEEWQEIRRVVNLEHDSNQKYIGRSQAYLPIYKQARTGLVSHLTRGLFPSDEYMDVMAKGVDPEMGRPVKDYIQYEFETAARLRLQMKPFLKQFLDYGWSVAKVMFHKEPVKRMTGKLALNALSQDGLGVEAGPQMRSVEGLRFVPRSVFNVYVWPPTVDNIEEASLVFEDVDVPKWLIEQNGRNGKWVNVQDALDAPIVSEHQRNQQQLLLDTMENSNLPHNSPSGGDLSHWRTLQECWLQMPLPAKAYVQGEDKEAPLAVKVILAGDKVIEVTRHPYWHGMVPYLTHRMDPEPGSFYSKGNGRTARFLQYLVNDFANQLNDNMTYGLNPMAKVNPGTLAGPLTPLRPGGIWLTTDPAAGIQFDRPPVEQVQYGLTVMNTWVGMLMDTIGAPPILQGSNASKGAKTATSSQILQRNAMSPIQDVVEDLEQAVMVPLMRMAHSLGQQYRNEEVWVNITGQPPQKVSPSQLVGDFQFRWLASSQAMNQQQRAQQAMTLLQMVQSVAPLLQAQGKMVNPEPLLKRIFSDGFGFRGYDQFIVPMQMPGMMGPPGMEPGAPPAEAPESNVRTANQSEMQPGEGEDFANVRDEADELSALLGGGGLT